MAGRIRESLSRHPYLTGAGFVLGASLLMDTTAQASPQHPYVQWVGLHNAQGSGHWPIAFDPTRIGEVSGDSTDTERDGPSQDVTAEPGADTDDIPAGDCSTNGILYKNSCTSDAAIDKKIAKLRDAGRLVTKACLAIDGPERILCEAKKYGGIDYKSPGGQQGAEQYHKDCPDPRKPGGPGNPCGQDCAGHISRAVHDAYGGDPSWSVSRLKADSEHFEKISFSKARPGDVVTHGDSHAELFVRMSKDIKGWVDTYGAHRYGEKSGPSKWTYDSVYRYKIPDAARPGK